MRKEWKFVGNFVLTIIFGVGLILGSIISTRSNLIAGLVGFTVSLILSLGLVDLSARTITQKSPLEAIWSQIKSYL